MANLALDTPISQIYMIGEGYAKKLVRLNIKTVSDLLYHFPSRYLDYSLISKISSLQPGKTVTVVGEVVSAKNIYTKRHKKIQKLIVKDNTGQIEATWFNQPFLVKNFKPGQQVSLSGQVDRFAYKLSLSSPEYEVLKSQTGGGIHTGRLVPIYPETRGISSKWLRSRLAPLIKTLVPNLKDFIPQTLLDKYQLENLPTALTQIHFPENRTEFKKAKKRLAFDEMFLIQLAALERKRSWQKKKTAQQFKIDQDRVLDFISSLPFKLTRAQKRVSREILTDLGKTQPMNRLLQGDVGSGKTVVAAEAIYIAFLNQSQSVVMAPTEILAQQHYQSLKTLLGSLGVKTKLITSSTKNDSRPLKHNQSIDLVIGTHALIYKKFKPENVGLIVIDEQHRFGVVQRGQLIEKTTQSSRIFPHLLTMTATPIPRTIALTLYGDLDLSIIDQLPDGRQPIKTWLVPPQKRTNAYSWIKKQIKKEAIQVFMVCPLIEESLAETLKDIKAVTSEFNKLQKIFSGLKLGLLHGRLRSKEKTQVIDSFKSGDINILVSTPVVEVGIDIPNATIMIIEDAQRFGLAQLHQLRGRVGRGQKQSYCLLFSGNSSPKINKRLKHLETIHQGSRVAEIDLELRGPGEMYGLKQHGFLDLRLASFNDRGLIETSRRAAKQTIKRLNQFSDLKNQLEKFKISYILNN